MTVKLDVKERTETVDAVRKAGRVPGIVYGPKQEPVKVSVEGITFEKMLAEAGEATIISLEGLSEPIEVLIHDVSFNAARGGAEHVDFYAIERGKELTVDVPLEFEGEAPAEKSGAMVTKVAQSVEVTCRPSALPSHVTVDISVLVDEESQIKVSDLSIPEGVTVETDPEQVVAMVSAAREEEPEEAPEAPDMDAIEVEGEKADDAEEKAAE
jgi:large subunit ribosomal protein L25